MAEKITKIQIGTDVRDIALGEEARKEVLDGFQIKLADDTLKGDKNSLSVNVKPGNAIGTGSDGISVMMDKTSIGTNANGELSVNFGDGLTIENGKLIPKIGSGLTFEDGAFKPKLGSGLLLDAAHSTIRPNCGKGLQVSGTDNTIEARLGSGLKFHENKISLDTADGIKFNDGGAAMVDYEAVATTLAANSSAIKTVEVGTGVKCLDLDMSAVADALTNKSTYVVTDEGGSSLDLDVEVLADTLAATSTSIRRVYSAMDEVGLDLDMGDIQRRIVPLLIDGSKHITANKDNALDINAYSLYTDSDSIQALAHNKPEVKISGYSNNALSLATEGLGVFLNGNAFQTSVNSDNVTVASLKLKTNGGLQTDANGLSVKLGGALEIDNSGNVGVNAGTGLLVDANAVYANLGTDLQTDIDGAINIRLGQGLWRDEEHGINVGLGTGLAYTDQYRVGVNLGTLFYIDSEDFIRLNVGSGVFLEQVGTDYTSERIAVRCGNGITTNSGAVSVVPNTSKGIEVSSSGVGIKLPIASCLRFNSAGDLTMAYGEGLAYNSAKGLQLAAATADTIGGVKKVAFTFDEALSAGTQLKALCNALSSAGILDLTIAD